MSIMSRLCILLLNIHLKGPSLIPGSWIMMRNVPCILLLEWSTTSQRLWVYMISVPYAKKIPDSHLKRVGATPGILVSRLNNRW